MSMTYCGVCGNPFEVINYQYGDYCSKECLAKSKEGGGTT